MSDSVLQLAKVTAHGRTGNVDKGLDVLFAPALSAATQVRLDPFEEV